MDEKILQRLEFDKIRTLLAQCAGSPLGKEMALALEPYREYRKIVRAQAETNEGRKLLRFEQGIDLGGWHDIRPQLSRVERGAALEAEELFEVGQTLKAVRRIKKFFKNKQSEYPLIGRIVYKLEVLPELEEAIEKAILPGGEVSDHASAELAQVRRRLVAARNKIKEHLEQIINTPRYRKYLQDPVITIREGRYVVPVKQEYREQVPGIVHDQSASGATLFVEPIAVVERNNEVRRMESAERQEVARILDGLSTLVFNEREVLEKSLEGLGQIDFIMAKADFSRKIDGSSPAIKENPYLNLKSVRHPLLKGKVVPIDIHLGKEFDILVITGPNTGGKTVTLKSTGLLILMAQSGLHIPAETGSEVGVFQQVYADIGDEQSIEQSLSTFSSHMKNIIKILKDAGPQSLVLLDELGAGTDPAEGAALARAILQQLQFLKAKVVATTHYSELKDFAYKEERVENASVEFDPETLMPTYRLAIGRPGRSNAFEIAGRLGLAKSVIDAAKKFMPSEQIEAREIIKQLEMERRKAGEALREAEKLRNEAGEIKAKYEKLERDIRQKKDKLVDDARKRARQIVREARKEAEAAIMELREKISAGEGRVREKAIQEVRKRLKEMQGEMEETQKPEEMRKVSPDKLKAGEEIFLPKYNQRGYVLEKPQNNEVLVQVGIMKMSVPVDELYKVEKKSKKKVETKKQENISRLVADKAGTIDPEIDLRGMYVEDALQEVEKYLDDAYLAGLTRVSLIHGKGTGALRAAVHHFLAGNRRVKSFRLGMHGEGGAGVTVVELAR